MSIGIEPLGDMVLIELEQAAEKTASGSVIEARLDKGKGYITTLLVQNGNLLVGDYFERF